VSIGPSGCLSITCFKKFLAIIFYLSVRCIVYHFRINFSAATVLSISAAAV
jgi:hypothetical protein